MDPQKLLLADKRIIKALQIIGVIASTFIGVFCILIGQRIIIVPGAFLAATWPLATGLIVLGLVQWLWNPYTNRKVYVYLRLYLLAAALISILVTGFPNVMLMSWLLLLIVINIYYRQMQAFLGYVVMGASLLAWMLAHLDLLSIGSAITLIASYGMVGATILVSAFIWRFTNEAVHNLEVSHAKEDLQRSQLTSLINSMADGVIAVDQHAKVMLYNAAALNILDLNSSMQTKLISTFLKPIDTEHNEVNLTKLVKNTKTPTINRDLRIKYADGSVANLYLAIAPVHMGYGKGGTQGYVLLLRDITREKSLEEERDEFISVVSHELRTPIAISEGNISNAQLISERGGDPAIIQKALLEAHNQVLFLADMINDLATLSRAERGVLKLEVEQIDVTALVNELYSNYSGEAQAKGLTLKIAIAEGIGQLSSGKLYVREVLQNFITNAIKYTEAGSVTITAKPADKGIMFEVTDTGIGISKGDQERVFDKFFRSEDFRTRKNNGTGLGLYVTMKLTRMLHAKIDLESELNKGSTFKIFIPSLAAEPAK